MRQNVEGQRMVPHDEHFSDSTMYSEYSLTDPMHTQFCVQFVHPTRVEWRRRSYAMHTDDDNIILSLHACLLPMVSLILWTDWRRNFWNFLPDSKPTRSFRTISCKGTVIFSLSTMLISISLPEEPIFKYMTSNIDGRRISCQTSSSKTRKRTTRKSRNPIGPMPSGLLIILTRKRFHAPLLLARVIAVSWQAWRTEFWFLIGFQESLYYRTRIPFSMHLLVTLLTCGDGVFETRSGNRINQIRSNYSFSFSLPLQLYHKEIAILRTTPLSRTWIPFRLPLQLYH